MTAGIKKKAVPLEDQEQIALADWLRTQKIKFYAIPNGGYRYALEALKFKRMGAMAGVPDICIPIPSGVYHGLYIELKRRIGGVISDNQQSWLEFLNETGYYARVAYGFDEAREIVLSYLALTKPAA